MRVFLFRGLAGQLFSKGMDQLSRKLNDAGHVATVHSWLERTAVQSKAIEDVRSGALRESIGLVGHSLGGNSANYMANNLVRSNVDVAYVATIDPTEPKANPIGVTADNFRSRDFRAEKVRGAVDFFFPELNHIQIDKANKVHRRILEICASREAGTTPSRSDTEEVNLEDLSNLSASELLALLTRLLQQLK